MKIASYDDVKIDVIGLSKKPNELMTHTYASLYGLPVTGPSLFTKKILNRESIDVFNVSVR